MKFDENIRNEKLRYNINREVVKTSTLTSVKIDEYEYLTDEEILASDQNRVKLNLLNLY